MDLDLAGRAAVVTGAGRGIGLAITEALLAEGAAVVAVARDVGPLAGRAGVLAIAADLTDPAVPADVIRRAIAEHGRVDVLINNVGGVRLRLDGFPAVDDDAFRWALELNFFTTLRMTRAAVAAMLGGRGGAIVNIASVNAFFQPDGATVDYGAAKAAVVNLTTALAQELGPAGIRVNAISPGPVETDLWLGEHGVAATVAAVTGTDAESARAQAAAAAATRRFTRPDEVAALAVVLASGRVGNMTGANVVIDGGLVKTS